MSIIPNQVLTALGLLGLALLTGCATSSSDRDAKLGAASAISAARDQSVKLQIFLDANNFGPGVVDGREGEFTAKALDFYRQSQGLAADAQPDLRGIKPYTSYTIAPEDRAVLGTMASEPAEIAKQSKLPYTGLLELLGERFHTTRQFIADLNPGQDVNNLPAGATITVPNVARPFYADQFPSSYPAGPSGRKVLVDTKFRMLTIREGDRLIAAFPITPGSPQHPVRVGDWRIEGAVPWPWYRYDKGVLERGQRTDTFYNYPPGVNSPVGILWAGLSRPGIGIHGTGYPETIGRAGSHGCIRLANWDAAAFYTLIRKGTQVTIK